MRVGALLGAVLRLQVEGTSGVKHRASRCVVLVAASIRSMAPGKSDPNKSLIGGYVPTQLKEAVKVRAEAEGIDETEAIRLALEMWLNAEERPSA